MLSVEITNTNQVVFTMKMTKKMEQFGRLFTPLFSVSLPALSSEHAVYTQNMLKQQESNDLLLTQEVTVGFVKNSRKEVGLVSN
jgi:hypothetical protein